MECSFRAREFVIQNEDPIFKYHGGTHKIAFCVEDLVVDSLLDDDQAFNVDQYAKIWATGDIKTTQQVIESRDLNFLEFLVDLIYFVFCSSIITKT